MQTVKITGKAATSLVHVGEHLENLGRYCPENSVIVTDKTVAAICGSLFPPFPVITTGQGEGEKTLASIEKIYQGLLDLNADRSSFLVGVGGGVVCDMAGFAASTFMRGIGFGFVASTLLAQVDASVGGKNGVNFSRYKNMVGVFAQPKFVICDTELLKSLHKDELANGFAEIVKHGAMADAAYFRYIEENAEAALALDKAVTDRLVLRSVEIKAAVVSADEREAGERRKLNFGHTIGHAFEKVLGISHGRAVSAGMAAAARMSVSRGLLSRADEERLTSLLFRLGLPVSLSADKNALFDAVTKDKKREGGSIKFVLLKGLGQAVVEDIPLSGLKSVLAQMEE